MPVIATTRHKAFPDRVAFDNPIANYFEVAFSRDISVSKELDLKRLKEPFHLIDMKPELAIHEATLFFRPYLRWLSGAFNAKVSFRFDLDCGFQSTPEDQTVIKDIPVGYLMVKDMQDPKLERPLEQLQSSWPIFPTGRSWCFYARPCWGEGYPEGSGDTVLGLFGPRSSSVTGWLKDLVCTDDCRVEVGILAAVYTTKLS